MSITESGKVDTLATGDVDESAPLWIISFCDMSLLLLCFFILLLAISNQSPVADDEMLRILASIKVAFGYVPEKTSTTKIDAAVSQILSARNTGFTRSAMRWSSPAVEGDYKPQPNLFGSVKGAVGKPILFARGSSTISLDWNHAMEETAEIVRHHYREIVIQGHCSPEEAAGDSLGGHDLAFRRALAVKQKLEELGVASSRMRLVSCASFDSYKIAEEKKDPKAKTINKDGSGNMTYAREKNPNRQRAVVTLGSYLLPGGGSDLSGTTEVDQPAR